MEAASEEHGLDNGGVRTDVLLERVRSNGPSGPIDTVLSAPRWIAKYYVAGGELMWGGRDGVRICSGERIQ
jgi:hypothetical protein